MRFDTEKAEPGDVVKLSVRAEPFSKAHISVVDQSVLLMRKPNELTDEMIESQISNEYMSYLRYLNYASSFHTHQKRSIQNELFYKLKGFWDLPDAYKTFRVHF